jgi:ABC-type glycerol-3-phosphate transport system permease component
MVMAGALLAMAPLILMFVLFARNFVADLAKGALKS